jgi:leucyl/phenylalanyl-tRNA--protein transferase
VPIEPAPPRWVLPDLQDLPAGQDLVAVGADLAPGMLLAGYRAGVFAMPEGRELGWWSPDPRGVLLPGQAHTSRSLRRALNRYRVSLDRAFAEVVGACADPRRPHGWISAAYQHSYLELHQLGWAHSIEVWRDGQLAGGLYGVSLGRLFFGESMFTRERDASKIALYTLARQVERWGFILIDCQVMNPHLNRLGVTEMPRATFLRHVRANDAAETRRGPWRLDPDLAGPSEGQS